MNILKRIKVIIFLSSVGIDMAEFAIKTVKENEINLVMLWDSMLDRYKM